MAEPLKINLKETANYTYDDWLEYFRKIPAAVLLSSQKVLKEQIPTEGYAAAARWIEIISKPSKMDKLYQGRLKAGAEKDLMDLAVGDSDEEFYISLIRENVTQLNTSNITQQEVARLTQNINLFRKELREIRSRKPKSGTPLERVLKAADLANAKPKKPKKTTKKKTPAKKEPTGKKQGSDTASKAGKSKKTNKVSKEVKK